MPPRLYVKPGVSLNGLDPAGCRILAVVSSAPAALGHDLTITCGLDSHGPTDPHTLGAALDLRPVDLTPTQIITLYKYFAQTLGPDFFTTLYEVPHADVPTLDPLLVDYVYAPSNPTAAHLHLQRRIGTVFTPTPIQV